MMLVKLNDYMLKNEDRFIFIMLNKIPNRSTISTYEQIILNLIKEKVRNTFELSVIRKNFLNKTMITQTPKPKLISGTSSTEKLLYIKGHHRSDKATTYRMGKYFYQLHIQ